MLARRIFRSEGKNRLFERSELRSFPKALRKILHAYILLCPNPGVWMGILSKEQALPETPGIRPAAGFPKIRCLPNPTSLRCKPGSRHIPGNSASNPLTSASRGGIFKSFLTTDSPFLTPEKDIVTGISPLGKICKNITTRRTL